MTRPSNQEIERHYFEQFRTHYPIPEGEIKYTDKPDVMIRGTGTLGVEIANLYITSGSAPESEQVQRRRRLHILDRAQSLHLASGGKRTELSVDFDPRHPIEQTEPLARALADLAVEIAHLPTGQVSPRVFERVPQLRFIYYNATEYSDAKWRTVQSYTVPALSVERIREVVSEKVEKSKAYQPCDTYWLLLVVDFMDFAQDQDLLWPAGTVLDASPFERVLLYKPQFGQVIAVAQ